MGGFQKAGFFHRLGQAGYVGYTEALQYLFLLTEVLFYTVWPRSRRGTQIPGALGIQLFNLGYKAAPIVVLLSFLIGLTLALQSVMQLQKFGASSFLAAGIGISMVSEIGPVLTAVIIAGRSGSAITAEIASMAINEEIKALKVMGLKPLPLLLLPRFWALSVMGPVLTLLAVITGISAGFFVSTWVAQLSPMLFGRELALALTPMLILQSLFKSIIFSWIIVLVAIRRGFLAQGGALEVGKQTTACVVYSICGIIAADAFLSFFFY